MLAYIFPGQGAQHVGMGEELLNDFVTLERRASEILGYSLKSLCLDNKDDKINKTQYTQPALFAINALTYIKHYEETGVDPDYVAGHSLGEYNALFVADVFDFCTGINLVKRRGELMSEVDGGSMAAVITDNIEDVIDIINEDFSDVDIANLNADNQVVLSGPSDSLTRVNRALDSLECQFIPLPVSAAFHSRYMESVAQDFRQYLDTVAISPPRIKVISNVTSTPYPDDVGAIKDLLAKQIVSSVRWTDTVHYLRREAVDSFREMGPGQVLTGLLRNIA